MNNEHTAILPGIEKMTIYTNTVILPKNLFKDDFHIARSQTIPNLLSGAAVLPNSLLCLFMHLETVGGSNIHPVSPPPIHHHHPDAPSCAAIASGPP